MINVKVKGARATSNLLENWIQSLDKQKIINRAGEATVKFLKSKVGVRTGKLKRSVVWEPYSRGDAAIRMQWYGLYELARKKLYGQGIFRDFIRKEIQKAP